MKARQLLPIAALLTAPVVLLYFTPKQPRANDIPTAGDVSPPEPLAQNSAQPATTQAPASPAAAPAAKPLVLSEDPQLSRLLTGCEVLSDQTLPYTPAPGATDWRTKFPASRLHTRVRQLLVQEQFDPEIKHRRLRLEEVTLAGQDGGTLECLLCAADHFSVSTAPGTTRETLAGLLPGGFTVLEKVEPSPDLFLVSMPAATAGAYWSQSQSLAAVAGIVHVEPNVLAFGTGVPNDPDLPFQWALHNSGQTVPGFGAGTTDADMDAPEAWDLHTGSEQVIVGIVDSGIDYEHPDLAPNMHANRGWDFVGNDDSPMDTNGHGTQCAGIIGAAGHNGTGTCGVCWTVKMKAYRALSGSTSSGQGFASNLIASIDRARLDGCNVLNCSWELTTATSAQVTSVQAALTRAANADIVIIAGAGNRGRDIDLQPTFPACFSVPGLICVGSSTQTDTIHYEAAATGIRSNYGATNVDLFAPGRGILTCQTHLALPPSPTVYVSGTSFACAQVTGAAALLRAYRPHLGAFQIKAKLLATVDREEAFESKCHSDGRLNLHKLLRACESAHIPQTMWIGASLNTNIGESKTAIIVGKDGRAYNWGMQADGTMRTSPEAIPDLYDVREVIDAESFIHTDGTVTFRNHTVPGLSGVRSLFSRDEGSGVRFIYVKEDNTLWTALLSNPYNPTLGQLQHGPLQQLELITNVPMDTLSWAKNYFHVFALSRAGEVWRLSRESPPLPGQTAVTADLLPGVSNVQQVVVDSKINLSYLWFLHKDGTVSAQGHTANPNPLTDPTVPVPELTGIAQLAPQLALGKNGRIYGGGPNFHGVLGSLDPLKLDPIEGGMWTNVYPPQSLAAPDQIIQIATHSPWGFNSGTAPNGCLALRDDGTVLAWGDNTNSILGRGTGNDNPALLESVSVGGGLKVDMLGGGNGEFSVVLASDGTCWFSGGGVMAEFTKLPVTYPARPVQIGTNYRNGLGSEIWILFEDGAMRFIWPGSSMMANELFPPNPDLERIMATKDSWFVGITKDKQLVTPAVGGPWTPLGVSNPKSVAVHANGRLMVLLETNELLSIAPQNANRHTVGLGSLNPKQLVGKRWIQDQGGSVWLYTDEPPPAWAVIPVTGLPASVKSITEGYVLLDDGTLQNIDSNTNTAFTLSPMSGAGNLVVASWISSGVLALDSSGKLFVGGHFVSSSDGSSGNGTAWSNRPLPVLGLNGVSTGIGSVHAGEGTSWKLEHFTIPEITAGKAEYEADPDKDGYDNLLEYSLGLDPRHTNTMSDLPQVALENLFNNETGPPAPGEEKHLTMTVHRPSYFSDVDFAVEVSDDMHTWQCGDECTLTLLDTPTTLKVMDREPMSEVSRRFMRLRVFRTVP